MTRRFQLASKIFAAVGVLTLVAAACSSGNNKAASPGSTSPSASASAEAPMMPLPPGAEKLKVNIVSPKSGLKLTENALKINVSFAGFSPNCDWAGKDNKNGIAHYHVLLDKSLINMFCTKTATISMQNVKSGMHTLAVVPALNDHQEVLDNEQEIEFDYEPTNALRAITAESTSAKPSIEILSPVDGVTLSGPFTLKVRISNFEDSCGLLGKPDVAGYGHWHVNVDSMTGPMMGMMTMLGMSCTDTFTSTTIGLTPGTHTIFALLTDNGHAPLEIFDKIDVTVK